MTKNQKIITVVASCFLSACLVGLSIWGIVALTGKNKKADILCTTFAAFDWTRQILGDSTADYNIHYLLEDGMDLHNYQATPADIVKIKKCKLLIYIGGESDEWLQDVLDGTNIKTLALLEIIENAGKALDEEIKDGMADEDEEEGEEEDAEKDEHVWLSLKNAQICVDAIADALCEIYPGKADTFNTNANSYKSQLNALDLQYTAAVAYLKTNSGKSAILFGDRFPFRYLTNDYEIEYWAAFAGCSAETEASAVKFTFLIEKVNTLNLDAVLVIETSDKSIARTIVNESHATKILVMDSAQSVVKSRLSTATYLSIMQNNLTVLCEALKAA